MRGWLFLVLLVFGSAVLFLKPQTAASLSAVFPKPDAVLLAQIQNQIAAHPVLAPLNIQVRVANADVSLSGNVANKEQAKALIILAESVAGVHTVEVSGLTLAKGRLTTDDLINSLVVGTFNREGLMGPLSQLPITRTVTGIATATTETPPPAIHIQVQTKEGVVYLSGSVPDQATMTRAESLANAIPGVKRVQSTLTSSR